MFGELCGDRRGVKLGLLAPAIAPAAAAVGSVLDDGEPTAAPGTLGITGTPGATPGTPCSPDPPGTPGEPAGNIPGGSPPSIIFLSASACLAVSAKFPAATLAAVANGAAMSFALPFKKSPTDFWFFDDGFDLSDGSIGGAGSGSSGRPFFLFLLLIIFSGISGMTIPPLPPFFFFSASVGIPIPNAGNIICFFALDDTRTTIVSGSGFCPSNTPAYFAGLGTTAVGAYGGMEALILARHIFFAKSGSPRHAINALSFAILFGFRSFFGNIKGLGDIKLGSPVSSFPFCASLSAILAFNCALRDRSTLVAKSFFIC